MHPFEYAERWGVRIVHVMPPPSCETFFRAPLHTLHDHSRSALSGWVDFDRRFHAGFDPTRGFIYWPKTRIFPPRGLVHWNYYLFLHELAHLLVGALPPSDAAEDGLLCAFEFASVRYMTPSTHIDRWRDWRVTTGSGFERPLAHGKRHFPALVRRGFFHKSGMPNFQPYRLRAIPSPLPWNFGLIPAISPRKTG